ncbi:MAG: alpha/beta fold hydrolase [Parvibaculum sp.]|nr:alpha/beta fold hydrolase [Parvibaculum sp.]
MSGITEKAFRFKGADGHSVAAWRWSKPVPVRAVLQIAHGMGEHSLRYKSKLEALMDAGIVIYANDHRGHGATAPTPAHYGDFGASGFPALVSDMALLTAIAREENPDVPVILLGHSMGSFAAQLYVIDHSHEIDGLVISGSSAMDEIVKVLPADPDAPALDAFNGAFEPARTPFDWLSRDEAEVDAYVADPMCGFSVTPDSMGSMVVALLPTAEDGALKKIRADLPVYFFSGDKDPVGGPDLAFLNVLVDRYAARGLKVSKDFYKGGRHEMINETNRNEVVANLRKFIEGISA